jgi:hypothetical protein
VLVMPLSYLLSPAKVRQAFMLWWHRVPELPDRKTWPVICDRWLNGIGTMRVPGWPYFKNLRACVEDTMEEVRKAAARA